MQALLDGFRSLLKPPKTVIDNPIYQLHYRVTTIILLAFSMLISAHQFFGEPIKCMHKQSKNLPKDFLNIFCWIHTTYSVESSWNKTVGQDIPYPGVDNHGTDDKLIFHAYYQWVCLFLFVQAMTFYFPHSIWKSYAGRRIKGLAVEELTNPVIEHDVRDLKAGLLATCLCESRGRNNTIMFFVYFATEWLNFLNPLIQLTLMNAFLGGQFTHLGLEILSLSEWDWQFRNDQLVRVFPRMTKCTFHTHGDSGDVTRYDALCILPLNIINEKIYVFLWFWLYFLALASFYRVFHQTSLIFSSSLRISSLNMTPKSLRQVKRLMGKGKLSIGDMFILKLLSKNLDPLHLSRVVDFLYSLLNPKSENGIALRSTNSAISNSPPPPNGHPALEENFNFEERDSLGRPRFVTVSSVVRDSSVYGDSVEYEIRV